MRLSPFQGSSPFVAVRRGIAGGLFLFILLCGTSKTQAQKAEFVGIGFATSNAIYSMDGINWSNSPEGLKENTGSGFAAYGNGVFVTVDYTTDGETAYSGDGILWTNGLISADGWENVCFGNGQFFASTAADRNVALSTNGIDWTVYTNAFPSGVGYYCLAYGNGVYVAIISGGGTGAYSTNGIDWTASTMPYDAAWQSVTYGKGVFAAIVGGTSQSAFSTNGIDWVAGTNLPSADWAGITYGNGKFVAIADYSDIAAYSTDGMNWTESSTSHSDNWYTTAYTSNTFVTLSQGDGESAYSTDGISWSLGSSVPAETYYGIAGRKDPPVIITQPTNAFAVVGDSGTFAVEASGFPAPAYQWALDGTNVAGATNSSLSLYNVQPSNGGSYTVIVSNEFGSVTSSVATLTIGGYITSGLAAYWRLNDGAGTNAMDSSGNGVIMPMSNTPSWGSNYLILNGTNQYGDAGSGALTGLDQHDKTICAWINTAGSPYTAIVDKSFYDGTGFNGGWSFRLINNQLVWTLENGTLYDNSGAFVTTSQWIFVAVVWHYSMDAAEFYINGLLTYPTSDGGISENPSGAADLELGNLQNNDNNGQYAFGGYMRDVAVYNQALSSNNILTNFLSTQLASDISVPNPDLLYYKMTEGSANTNTPQYLSDSSAHGGTTGTIEGAYVIWTNDIIYTPMTAVHFNGSSDYVDTGEASLFNFTTNSFSINLWVLPNNGDGMLMGNSIYQNSGWYLSVNSDQIHFGSETSGAEHDMYTPNHIDGWPSPDAFGEWAMVTITRAGTNAPTIYINGIPIASEGSFTSPSSSSNNLLFGVGTNSLSAGYYDGDLWQPQIWSTTLSPAEVANLYFNQQGAAHWP